MSYLMKTSTKFLGELTPFKRESFMEGFIASNPRILSPSSEEDAPEGLVPVYIIGRQEMCELVKKGDKGITDLVSLIWDPLLEKYQVWIYELKVNSSNINDVQQLLDYLEAIDSPENKILKDDILSRARGIVGDKCLDTPLKIRGALCAEDFSDEVMKKILDANLSRGKEDKLLAVEIQRFNVRDEDYVVVQPFIGEDETRRNTYYDDIPDLPETELKENLVAVLLERKNKQPERFKQLKVFLELLTNNPKILTQDEIRNEWERRNLPRDDRGLSVSQLIGYKDSGPLRQIIGYDLSGDKKNNYRLKEDKYSELLRDVLEKV